MFYLLLLPRKKKKQNLKTYRRWIITGDTSVVFRVYISAFYVIPWVGGEETYQNYIFLIEFLVRDRILSINCSRFSLIRLNLKKINSGT